MSDKLDFHEDLDGGMLWSKSALRVWWFTRIRGYRVVKVRQIPRSTAMGGVRFDTRWLLKPGPDDS